MAHINLLPWREAERKERNTEFGILAGIAVGAMLLVVAGVHFYFQAEIEYQQQRNDMLTQQIARLDKKIKEIRNLEEERERLVKRMEVIQNLQSSRPLIVRMFDELVRVMPDGVSFESIKQKGNVVTIKGVAQSNARVSSFMRNIENSEWLTRPSLNVIRTQEQDGQRLSRFELKLMQKIKKSDDEEEEEI